jgi:hypothetical protein
MVRLKRGAWCVLLSAELEERSLKRRRAVSMQRRILPFYLHLDLWRQRQGDVIGTEGLKARGQASA